MDDDAEEGIAQIQIAAAKTAVTQGDKLALHR